MHDERIIVEILKRLDNAERKLREFGRNKTNIIPTGEFRNVVGDNDHRFLDNLNSEEYMHLTGEEYRSLSRSSDHGSLAGLGDNDHPQYILHQISNNDFDMLVGNAEKYFDVVPFDELRTKISEKFYPENDSETAIVFYASDRTTPIVIIDTINKKIGIKSDFKVSGDVFVNNGKLSFTGILPSKISSDNELEISSGKQIVLDAYNGIIIKHGTNIQSEGFAEDARGWHIKDNGDAFFRNVRVNKINARIILSNIEQYVGGRQTMCKSSSPLSYDFIVPAPLAESTICVEPFADFTETNVFDDGDVVRLAVITLSNAGYTVTDCWGTVTRNVISGNNSQTYRFIRSGSPNSGNAIAGSIVKAGELVLNFGTSGSGYIISSVV